VTRQQAVIRTLILAVMILLLALPLVPALREFARDVVLVELLHFFWAIGLLAGSLPQEPLWVLFILIFVWISVRSLLGPLRFLPHDQAVQRPGPVQSLAHQIRRVPKGTYYRWNLARHLLGVVADVLAHRQRTTPDQIRRRLRRGTLDLPPEIQAYLQHGLAPVHSLSAPPRTWLKRLLSPPPEPAALDPEVQQVVTFLENQVEGVHEP
jgi:hypothetical protein